MSRTKEWAVQLQEGNISENQHQCDEDAMQEYYHYKIEALKKFLNAKRVTSITSILFEPLSYDRKRYMVFFPGEELNFQINKNNCKTVKIGKQKLYITEVQN